MIALLAVLIAHPTTFGIIVPHVTIVEPHVSVEPVTAHEPPLERSEPEPASKGDNPPPEPPEGQEQQSEGGVIIPPTHVSDYRVYPHPSGSDSPPPTVPPTTVSSEVFGPTPSPSPVSFASLVRSSDPLTDAALTLTGFFVAILLIAVVRGRP